MSGTIISIAAIAASVLLLLVLRKLGFDLGPPTKDGSHLCRLQPELLSPTEREFFGVLRSVACDRYGVLTKVRVGDILRVPGSGSLPTTARNKTQMKHADFVLCDPVSTRPLLVIELDDRSHDRTDRKSRDEFLDRAYAAAGLPILHWPAAHAYPAAQLDQAIRAKLDPQPALAH